MKRKDLFLCLDRNQSRSNDLGLCLDLGQISILSACADADIDIFSSTDDAMIEKKLHFRLWHVIHIGHDTYKRLLGLFLLAR